MQANIGNCMSQVPYHLIIISILIAKVQLIALQPSLKDSWHHLGLLYYMRARNFLGKWDSQILIQSCQRRESP